VGGFGAGLRVDGLLVGRRAVGARIGYERRKMKGPLPVRLLVAGCTTAAATSNGGGSGRSSPTGS
jgi:hypothetical protein